MRTIRGGIQLFVRGVEQTDWAVPVTPAVHDELTEPDLEEHAMATQRATRTTVLEGEPYFPPTARWVSEAPPNPRERDPWLPRYQRTLLGGDFAAITLSAVAAYLLRFSFYSGADPKTWTFAFFLLLPPLWVGVLFAFRAYEARFLGVGTEEYDRVLQASVLVLAIVATTSWAFKLEVARGFVIMALPLAAFLTLVWRYLARQHLHRRRARGEAMQTVLVAGHQAGVLSLLGHMSRSAHHGMDIMGVCLPRPPLGGIPGRYDQPPQFAALGVPVVGYLDEVAEVARLHDVDAVAVLPTPELDGPELRRLGWDLESTRAELLVAPAITEVVGPRVAIRPVNGLPLLHLERPEHTGARRIAKALVDRSAAALGLLVLAPLLFAVAVAVRLDSRGPAFYRPERVGKHGRAFTMCKFRSMVTDADAKLIDLRDGSEGNGVLFKMRADPRVTRVGRFLRAYSIDELPQLINVLKGEMSLVGPRPPLASEVALYGDDVYRRLLVKPGLTGLWQINGRSDLSWDESVRLDLRYVENWSFAFDFMILWKTFRAVIARSGAY